MLVSYNWLQEYFEDKLPEPDKLAGILNTRVFEVEGVEEKDGDHSVDLDVLPNRAHDCLSHYGVAKEIATLTGLKLQKLSFDEHNGDFVTKFDVDVESDMCLRFNYAEIENVVVGESPDELKQKLESIGQRSINTIVDITNVVMFELGQPMHAFDKDKIADEKLIVRHATDGETMTTLDDKEVTFDTEDVVITDTTGPLSIAGIKGGNTSGVTENTTSIIFEAANWNSSHVRKHSKKHGISTDSSKRYEHGISSSLTKKAIIRAIELVKKYAANDATVYSAIENHYPSPEEPKRIEITADSMNTILGLSLTDTNIENVLRLLDFNYEKISGTFFVDVPSERLDLSIKEDMAEEIGRVFGYEHLPEPEISTIDREPEINAMQSVSIKVRNALTGIGFSEIMTSSFLPEGEVKMLKSFADDRPFLRSTLIPGMEKSLEMNVYNADLLGLVHIKTFEIGKKFDAKGEAMMLCLGVGNNKVKKPTPANQLRDAAKVLTDALGVDVGMKISDTESVIEISLDRLVEKIGAVDSYDEYDMNDDVKFVPFSSYPFVLRDLSMWVPGSIGQEDDIIKTIQKEAGELLVNVTLFDVYEKVDEGKTSYALRLVFQSMDRTLADTDVNPIMDAVTEVFNKRDGVEVR